MILSIILQRGKNYVMDAGCSAPHHYKLKRCRDRTKTLEVMCARLILEEGSLELHHDESEDGVENRNSAPAPSAPRFYGRAPPPLDVFHTSESYHRRRLPAISSPHALYITPLER